MDVKDKIIVVTGGTAGIGYTTALKLKEKGAKVIVTGRDENKLTHAKEIIIPKKIWAIDSSPIMIVRGRFTLLN